MDSNQAPLNNPPDLPGLESVEVNKVLQHAAMLLLLLLASMPTFLLFMIYKPLLVSSNLWMLLGDFRFFKCLLFYLALVFWLVYKLVTDHYYLKVDNEGLTQKSLIRRFTIKWDDITGVNSRTTWSGSKFIDIASTNNRISIRIIALNQANTNPAMIRLTASLWIHLRRANKILSFILPDNYATLWDKIPDNIPQEMSWMSPQSKVEYTVTSTSLIAKSKSAHKQVEWKKVDKAWWLDRDLRNGIYILRKSAWIGLHAHYDPKNEESGRFILCIIRHLRQHGFPVVIPESLRRTRPVSIIASFHDVTIRPGKRARFLFPILVGSIALIPLSRLVMGFHIAGTNDVAFLVVCIAVSLILFVAFSVLNIKADDTGLSKRSIFGRRNMRWDEVASYERIFHFSGRFIISIKLTSHNGKKMLIKFADIFSTPDREKLIAYADYKLAHLLPTQEDQSPWLAQPSADLYDNTSIV